MYVDSAQNSDLAPFSGDLSQSEKLSENKPPLMWFQVQSKAKDSIKTAAVAKIACRISWHFWW